MMYQLFSFMIILIMNEKLFGMEDQFSIESFNSSQQRANTQHVIKLLIHYKKNHWIHEKNRLYMKLCRNYL